MKTKYEKEPVEPFHVWVQRFGFPRGNIRYILMEAQSKVDFRLKKILAKKKVSRNNLESAEMFYILL